MGIQNSILQILRGLFCLMTPCKLIGGKEIIVEEVMLTQYLKAFDHTVSSLILFQRWYLIVYCENFKNISI